MRQEGLEPPTRSLEGCCSDPPELLALLRGHEMDEGYEKYETRAAQCRDRLLCHVVLHSCSLVHLVLSRASRRMVGAAGFEPATSCSQSRRDTGLRYAPRQRLRVSGRVPWVNDW